MSYTNSDIAKFRRVVWNYWKRHGRHDLPWRRTKNPYRILFSEVMLQQTQVPRVSEKYEEFLKAFPSVRALAKVPLSDVLKVWSGMGYNRRAKFLRDAAKVIVGKHGGKVPRDFAALRALPGVGSYTASAVRVFAFNEPDVLIETNIRAAFIHRFFRKGVYETPFAKVSDTEILPIARKAAEGQDPKKWHWALMDYGAHIKKLYGNPTRRSAHYTRQSKFEGSLRQLRGAILRALSNGPRSEQQLNDGFTKPVIRNKKLLAKALEGLARDGLIVKSAGGRSASGGKKGMWGIV